MKIRYYPFAVASAHGTRMQDQDGDSYLDFLAAGGVPQEGWACGVP
jgi:4-aminobutyrate aminotransferase-like enzyme